MGLIKLYKSSFAAQYLSLLLLGGILWIIAFIQPQDPIVPIGTEPAYTLVYDLFSGLPLLSTLLAFGLLYFQALLINQVLVENHLYSRTAMISSLIYLVLMSHSLELCRLHPSLIANLFIIIGLQLLIHTLHTEDTIRQVYKAGLFFSLASLFYTPSLFLLVFVWASLFIFRELSWREWIVSLLAFITPYLFLAVYYFWLDDLDLMSERFMAFFQNTSLPAFNHRIGIYISWGIILLLSLLGLGNVYTTLSNRNINFRKSLNMIFFLLIICLIAYFYDMDTTVINNTSLMIPLSIILGIYLDELKKTKWVDFLIILLLLSIAFNTIISPFLYA